MMVVVIIIASIITIIVLAFRSIMYFAFGTTQYNKTKRKIINIISRIRELKGNYLCES